MNSKILNKRRVGFTLFIIAAFLFQLFIDPLTELTKGTGIGRILYILTIVSSASIVYLCVHTLWKMVFYYPEADRRMLFSVALRTPEGASGALIATGIHMVVIVACIFVAMLL